MNNNIFGAEILLTLDPCLAYFKQWLRDSEGYRASPYLDAGDLPTIGTGITYYPNGSKVTLMDKNISTKENFALVDQIMIPKINMVNSIVVTPIFPIRRIVLLDFVYNLGEMALATSTFLKLVNDNPNNPKIADEIMRWVYCDGKILKGLVRRRQREVDLYFS